jgi:hypothetical protein
VIDRRLPDATGLHSGVYMPVKANSAAIVPADRVERRIYFIRGQRVILSSDLVAALYGVPVRTLNQAVTRHKGRFPDDFMFQLDADEIEHLKSRIATSKTASVERSLRSQSVILKKSARGKHAKYLPYAFTEQGVAMLSAVLRSPTAVRVSIDIVRAFVRLRQLLASHEDLREKLEALERKLADHDEKFTLVFDAIRELMEPEEDPPKPPVGFHTEAGLPQPPKAKRK